MSPPDESVSRVPRMAWGIGGWYDPRPWAEQIADLEQQVRVTSRVWPTPQPLVVFHRPSDYRPAGSGKTSALGVMWLVAPSLPRRLWEMALTASSASCRHLLRDRPTYTRVVAITGRKDWGKTSFPFIRMAARVARDRRTEARSRRSV